LPATAAEGIDQVFISSSMICDRLIDDRVRRWGLALLKPCSGGLLVASYPTLKCGVTPAARS